MSWSGEEAGVTELFNNGLQGFAPYVWSGNTPEKDLEYAVEDFPTPRNTGDSTPLKAQHRNTKRWGLSMPGFVEATCVINASFIQR